MKGNSNASTCKFHRTRIQITAGYQFFYPILLMNYFEQEVFNLMAYTVFPDYCRNFRNLMVNFSTFNQYFDHFLPLGH